MSMDRQGIPKKGVISRLIEPVLFARRFLSNSTRLFVLVISSGVVSNVALLLVPFYIGEAVTALENGSFSRTIHIGILIILAYTVSAVVNFIVTYGAQYISQTYAFNLRKEFVAHLVRKKYLFFETQTSGDLLSRGTQDIEQTRNFILNIFTNLFPTIFLIIAAFILLFLISPYFSLLLALAVPLLVYLGMMSSRRQRPIWKQIRDTFGKLGEALQENIVGQRVVRGLSTENQEIEKYSSLTKQYFDENYNVVRSRVVFNSLLPLVIAGISSIIIGVGGYIDLLNRGDVGGLVSAVMIFSILTSPVSFIGRMIVFSENSRAAIARIQEITESGDEEQVEKSDDRLVPGTLSFDHVRFSRGDRVILRDVTFKVNPGEFIGITGKTGVGKTSLVNLITRYYEADSGSITLNGRNINDIQLSLLRSRISIVPQEINLLSGTIRENILFGLDAPDEMIISAARIAAISDFIESLPLRYDTMVGERGITLSGGQRQRIAIARAVLRNPLILILDDATSSVDPDTEITIFENLKSALHDSIIILISLRASALSFANKVLILEEGELKYEEGEEGNYVDRI